MKFLEKYMDLPDAEPETLRKAALKQTTSAVIMTLIGYVFALTAYFMNEAIDVYAVIGIALAATLGAGWFFYSANGFRTAYWLKLRER